MLRLNILNSLNAIGENQQDNVFEHQCNKIIQMIRYSRPTKTHMNP